MPASSSPKPQSYADQWRERVIGQGDKGPLGPASPLQLQGEAFPSPFTTQETNSGGRDKSEEEGEREKLANPLLKPHIRKPRGLSNEIKELIIEKHAQFASVSAIAELLATEFRLKVDRRTIENFNPDSPRCQCGKRLRSLFVRHREGYITETAKVAVAHQAHRLRLIQQVIDKATTSKDYNAALKGLELAAKEMGGLSQTIEHKGLIAHVHSNADEAKAELAMRLQAFIDAQPPMIELSASPSVDATPPHPPPPHKHSLANPVARESGPSPIPPR